MSDSETEDIFLKFDNAPLPYSLTSAASDLTLKRSGKMKSPPGEGVWTLTNVKEMAESDKGEGVIIYVYSGILRKGSEVHDVVCKLSIGLGSPNIRKEARLYARNLSHLWGVCVPYYYGRFETSLRDFSVTCFIVERGDPLPEDKSLLKLSKAFRWKILKAMYEIHDANVEHMNFDSRCVVVKRNQSGTGSEGEEGVGSIPLIIDFHHAHAYHACQRTSKTIVPFKIAKDLRDYKCDELHEVTTALCLWVPCQLSVGGITVDLCFAKTVTHLAAHRLQCGANRETVFEESYWALSSFRKAWKVELTNLGMDASQPEWPKDELDGPDPMETIKEMDEEMDEEIDEETDPGSISDDFDETAYSDWEGFVELIETDALSSEEDH